ncbi:MAG: hypothetical protein RL207_956 [Bacteroidota bacterium]|jgi:O-antigen ligase
MENLNINNIEDSFRFNYLSKTILLLSSFLLIIPIDILQSVDEQSGLPICLILLSFSPFFFLNRRDKDVTYLWLVILFCLISILSVSLFYGVIPVKALFSLAYLLLPVLGYYVALVLINNNLDFIFFYKWSSIFSILLSLSLIYSIFIIGDGNVRIEGTFQGDFFGFKLSGAYGVHSLGAHYFILIFLIFFYLLLVDKISFIFRVLCILSILTYLYLIIFSLSRELVLALFLFFLTYSLYKFKLTKTLFLILCTVFLLYIFGKDLIDVFMLAWESKLMSTSGASNLNDFSSGRIDLQVLAIKQIIADPFFGTGFNGYTLDYKSYKNYNNLEGWSTHIYYLTCIWKMGLIAFFFYIFFWFSVLKKMFKHNYSIKRNALKLLLIFVVSMLFINMFWDAFLAPNVMALFSFLCGSIISIKNKHYSKS